MRDNKEGQNLRVLMGDNEGKVEATLKQRGHIYGDYSQVIATRARIMSLLEAHHQQVNGTGIPDNMEVAIGDIVLKLVRGSGAPHYADSWHDLAGYATLIENLSLATKGREDS